MLTHVTSYPFRFLAASHGLPLKDVSTALFYIPLNLFLPNQNIMYTDKRFLKPQTHHLSKNDTLMRGGEMYAVLWPF